jgi:hypothetical protein
MLQQTRTNKAPDRARACLALPPPAGRCVGTVGTGRRSARWQLKDAQQPLESAIRCQPASTVPPPLSCGVGTPRCFTRGASQPSPWQPDVGCIQSNTAPLSCRDRRHGRQERRQEFGAAALPPAGAPASDPHCSYLTALLAQLAEAPALRNAARQLAPVVDTSRSLVF